MKKRRQSFFTVERKKKDEVYQFSKALQIWLTVYILRTKKTCKKKLIHTCKNYLRKKRVFCQNILSTSAVK